MTSSVDLKLVLTGTSQLKLEINLLKATLVTVTWCPLDWGLGVRVAVGFYEIGTGLRSHLYDYRLHHQFRNVNAIASCKMTKVLSCGPLVVVVSFFFTLILVSLYRSLAYSSYWGTSLDEMPRKVVRNPLPMLSSVRLNHLSNGVAL